MRTLGRFAVMWFMALICTVLWLAFIGGINSLLEMPFRESAVVVVSITSLIAALIVVAMEDL